MAAVVAPDRIIACLAACIIIAMFYSLVDMHQMSAHHRAAEEEVRHFITSHPTEAAGTPTAAGTGIQMQRAKPQIALQSYVYPHTQLAGDVLIPGSQHYQESAEDCAQACREHQQTNTKDGRPCNVWVWCADRKHCGSSHLSCWLKHQVSPASHRPLQHGAHVMWTSGTLGMDLEADPIRDAQALGHVIGARKFHIVVSAQGSAVQWQTRIHYYWYQQTRSQCKAQGGCDMGGWTRLLHSGVKDTLMEQLPTMVVDPLPQDMAKNTVYLMLNRPYAFSQWCSKVDIPERYVMMAEPDQIFLRPLPNFMRGENPAAFPSVLVVPHERRNARLVQHFTGPLSRLELEELPPTGSSPTFMTLGDLKRIVPQWLNVSVAVFNDKHASEAWGWTQEMYAFSIASWIVGVRQFDLFLHMMAQPPFDTKLEEAPHKPFYILHYTYGMDYDHAGRPTPGRRSFWRFDKRLYPRRAPPRLLPPPPLGVKNELVRRLINAINHATAAMPCWDSYARTGHVATTCIEDTEETIAAAQAVAAENEQGSYT